MIENNLLALVAYQIKEKLNWDAKNMKATNSGEADKYIQRSTTPGITYRKGWVLNS